MSLIALLVAAPTVLSDPSQVKELCKALRAQPALRELDPASQVSAREQAETQRRAAAGKVYQVEIPSKGFAFGRYRAQEELIELDGDRPLRALDDALLLDLDGTDEVAFNASRAQVTAFSAAKKAGTLKLIVDWQPSGERCAGSDAAEAWRIAGKALAWKIAGEEGTLAAAGGDGEPLAGKPRRAKVERVALDSDAAEPDDDGRARLSALQGGLDRCAQEAQHGGALVVSFDVRKGKLDGAQIIVDSLHDERAAECIARTLQGAQVAGAGHGTAALTLE